MFDITNKCVVKDFVETLAEWQWMIYPVCFIGVAYALVSLFLFLALVPILTFGAA
jgi:hypothetical protein